MCVCVGVCVGVCLFVCARVRVTPPTGNVSPLTGNVLSPFNEP